MSKLDDILRELLFETPTQYYNGRYTPAKDAIKKTMATMVNTSITARSHAGERQGLLDRIEQL